MPVRILHYVVFKFLNVFHKVYDEAGSEIPQMFIKRS